MKNLLLTLTLLMMIAGCKSPVEPEPDKFKPRLIGNWLLTSTTSADFVGEEYAMKSNSGDTILVSNTLENYSLSVEEDTLDVHDNDFNLVFSDSTIIYSPTDDFTYTIEYSDNSPALARGGTYAGRGLDGFHARFGMFYNCNNFLGDSVFYFTITRSDQTEPYKVYEFDAYGIFEVLDEFMPVCH